MSSLLEQTNFLFKIILLPFGQALELVDRDLEHLLKVLFSKVYLHMNYAK